MAESQFIRDVKLNVGTIEINSRSIKDSGRLIASNALRFSFKCELSVNKHPNVCDINIYNLPPDIRGKLTQGINRKRIVTLFAGYIGNRKQLYKGRTFQITHKRNTVDWVTHIRCQEGRPNFDKRVSISVAPGEKVSDLIIKMAEQLEGIDISQLKKKMKEKGSLNALFQDFKNGAVVVGKLGDELFKAIDNAGYEVSMQAERIIATEEGETIGTTINLSKDTGMIGGPEVGLEGLTKVRTLLNGDLIPHRRLAITAKNLDGSNFKIEQTGHTGDNFGQDWYTDMLVRPV